MTGVLSYSDSPRLARELAGASAALVPALGGDAVDLELDAVREGVAGRVMLLRSESRLSGDADSVVAAFEESLKRAAPSLVLIGSTKLGRMVAAKLAVRSGMGVVSEARALGLDGGSLTATRAAYAGKFNARVSCPLPCIALVPPGAYEPAPGGGRSVEEVAVQAPAVRVKRLEARSSKSALDLRGAKVIVSAGRGVRKKEDLAMVERLASALGGVMGASRPLSSDLGWLGEEYHIGLTGVYVHPDLYLAVGISGQLQHVAGIKDSKVIAAINKDRQAPIFQVADYGVVGDLYLVVPALLRAMGRGES